MGSFLKLFHVELHSFKPCFFRCVVVLFCFVMAPSCGVARSKIEIHDYIVMPNGMPISNTKSLNAFVFENDLNNQPFQDFISNTFHSNSLVNKSVNFKIEDVNLKLWFYDADDFERYFPSNTFVAANQENVAQKIGNSNKFIALSVTTNDNQDCLIPENLLYQKTITYLKLLKLNYFQKNGGY